MVNTVRTEIYLSTLDAFVQSKTFYAILDVQIIGLCAYLILPRIHHRYVEACNLINDPTYDLAIEFVRDAGLAVLDLGLLVLSTVLITFTTYFAAAAGFAIWTWCM